MSTAQQIIERSFSMIGIKAAETPLQASEMADGLDSLNDILAEWDATNMLKGGMPVRSIGDTLNIPRYAASALAYQLAVRIAHEYSVTLGPTFALAANNAISNMVTASVDLCNVDYPSSLPTGSGNRRLGNQSNFFPQKQKKNF